MILRPVRNMDLPLFLLLLSWSVLVIASDDPFDCHLQIGALTYDLTLLPGEQSVKREWPTPPTSEVDRVDLSLCSDLKHQEGVPDPDQVREECGTSPRLNLTFFQVPSRDACLLHQD